MGNDHPMNLLPSAVIGDADVARVLRIGVGVINPALDLVWGSDPIGLKRRTHDPEGDDAGAIDATLDAAAWVLNALDVPGTKAWQDATPDERINWWVYRLGAVDTVLVAFPGVLGVIASRLGVQDVLAFVSQTVVLCAVARELGVTDRTEQVNLLGAVMCDRDLSDEDPEPDVDTRSRNAAETVWHLVGVVRAIGDELDKRHRPRALFRMLGVLPGLGAVAGYLGEYGALVRAADEGRSYVATAAPTTAGGGRL